MRLRTHGSEDIKLFMVTHSFSRITLQGNIRRRITLYINYSKNISIEEVIFNRANSKLIENQEFFNSWAINKS